MFTENIKSKDDNLVKHSKENKILLNTVVEANETNQNTETVVSLTNVLVVFASSQIFNCIGLCRQSTMLIHRCFPSVADSLNFLELDYKFLVKILCSSELSVDSEVQVYTAAKRWLDHNTIERSKYAAAVLKRIRLPLIPSSYLRHILDSKCPTNDNFTIAIERVLQIKNQVDSGKPFCAYRHCSQSDYKVLLFGGRKHNNKVINHAHSINLNKTEKIDVLSRMNEGRIKNQVVRVKTEIYALGGRNNHTDPILSVEKYSAAGERWEIVTKMDDNRVGFCACSFAGDIYVMGGLKNGIYINSCVKFDTRKHDWKHLTGMIESRWLLSGCVFEGRIVVSGGKVTLHHFSNTVEVYDTVDDSWSYMPNLLEGRTHHKMIGMKNKLFVIGGLMVPNCEVYDSTCKMFVALKPPPDSCKTPFHLPTSVATLGNKLVVFMSGSFFNVTYDVETEEWGCEKKCEVTKNLVEFSCAIMPWL